MNSLTDLTYLKSFLKQSGLKPKHYLGQNFLVDQEVLDKILRAAELKKTDTVLEVGPGIGTLTVELAKYAGQVLAIEKDERFVQFLQSYFQTFTNVSIWKYDILKFHLDKHISVNYKVVANIPYYLTSVLLRYFLEQKNKPELLVLMVQKEVGERVVAAPGALSILGISVQFFADAEIVQRSVTPSPRRGSRQEIGDLALDPRSTQGTLSGDGFGEKRQPFIIPKTSFWPMPKVDSAILRIVPKEKYPEIKDKKLFFRIVKAGFAGKRKQVHNTLRTGLNLTKSQTAELLNLAGIDLTTRPQDISLDNWVGLYQALQKLI